MGTKIQGKLPQEHVTKKRLDFMLILDFIKKYNLTYTATAIGYHMTTGKIDYMQPKRDRFVVLTSRTKEFYGI